MTMTVKERVERLRQGPLREQALRLLEESDPVTVVMMLLRTIRQRDDHEESIRVGYQHSIDYERVLHESRIDRADREGVAVRFTLIMHAPTGDVFARDAFAKQIGTEVTFRAQSGSPAYSGELLAAEVIEDGRAARITLDLPDEAIPDDLAPPAGAAWSIAP